MQMIEMNEKIYIVVCKLTERPHCVKQQFAYVEINSVTTYTAS